MRLFLYLPFFLLVRVGFAQYSYPPAPTSNDTIQKFGYNIPDPYRPLENMQSTETLNWLKLQEEKVRQYRKSVFADYTVVEREMAMLLFGDINGYRLKSQTGAYYFRTRYDGADDHSPAVEFKIKQSDGWQPVLTTAQLMRNQNDVIDIRWILVSQDDSTVAIGISHGGSDWTEIRLINMNTLKPLPEVFEWTKYGMAWAEGGFFYNQYQKPEGNIITTQSTTSRVMFHKLGSPVTDDKEVTAGDSERSHFYTAQQGRFFVLYEKKNVNGRKMGVVSYVPTDSVHEVPLRKLIIAPGLDERDIDVLGEINGSLLVHSFYKAPRGAVIKYDRYKTNAGKVMVEMFNQTLLKASLVRDRLFCSYMDEGKSLTLVFDTAGKAVKTINAPVGSFIEGFYKPYRDSMTYYFVGSFSSPDITIKFNLNTLQSELPRQGAEYVLHTEYETEIVTYYGKDSTKLYMYLTHKKGLKPDVNTPVLLYAYGGFNVATLPSYNPMYRMILKRGGMVAVPLVRGGGEFGTAWHNGGRTKNKQNSIDDFCAAAEWLIAQKYTSAEKIAATGGSQGGWLIGTAAVQRPELFKVVVPIAGVYDLMRYTQFASLAGVGIEEYGDPDTEGDFHHLYKISAPYHVKEGVKYPNFLIIIGSDDDRVVPFHSFKLAAALQKNAPTDALRLLYLEENAGHNVSGTSDGYQQVALMYTFIMRQLGMRIQ